MYFNVGITDHFSFIITASFLEYIIDGLLDTAEQVVKGVDQSLLDGCSNDSKALNQIKW